MKFLCLFFLAFVWVSRTLGAYLQQNYESLLSHFSVVIPELFQANALNTGSHFELDHIVWKHLSIHYVSNRTKCVLTSPPMDANCQPKNLKSLLVRVLLPQQPAPVQQQQYRWISPYGKLCCKTCTHKNWHNILQRNDEGSIFCSSD